MEQIVQVVTTVGFPIGMCLILCWYIYNTSKSRADETRLFTEALNNNTLALQRLSDRMEEK